MSQTPTCERLLRVDTAQRYRLTATPSPNLAEDHRGLLGHFSLDIDHQWIEALHVSRHAFAADTTLAADLLPGATSMLIADASGWSNEPWESAETRSLAWYGYTDLTGHTYADYSYTRNVAFDFGDGLWAPGTIWYDQSVGAYRIPLNAPWGGPAVAAGTAVRNATSGPDLNEPSFDAALQPNSRWPVLNATIGGEWQGGERDSSAFRPGTAYVQLFSADALVWNELTFGPEHDFLNVPSTAVSADADRRFTLDLDVLVKTSQDLGAGLLAGDYNRDGRVDAADYTVWRDSLGVQGIAPYSSADGNGDGNVDELDHLVWRANFLAVQSFAIESATAIHGAATIVVGPAGEVVRYVSEPWFSGSDIIHYTLRDATTGGAFTSWVLIDVRGSNFEQNAEVVATLEAQAQVVAGNEAPRIASDVSYTTAEGQSLAAAGLLEPFSDPTDELVVRLLAGTRHGALALRYDGTFEYTPLHGFVGVDTFRYEAFDGLYATTAVATIEVLSIDAVTERQFREIAIAMLNHVEVFGRFPIASNSSYFDQNGLPYLSWRVHLLPFFGFQSLYDRFRLNEPWDSPDNLPLLAEMPHVYRSAGDAADSTTTRFQVFTGPEAPFGNRSPGADQIGPRLQDFRDGPLHTILVAESGADVAVPWTKPADLSFDIDSPFASLGTLDTGRIRAVMADGTPITVPASTEPATFKALVTINGREIVDAHTLRRKWAEATGGADAVNSYAKATGDSYFKNIALAVLHYEEVRGRFPVTGSGHFDEDGNPFLSWRVHILPFLGYPSLYQQFKLDEPWNSVNNLPLLNEMPDVFRSAGDPSDSTSTRIMTFTGPDAPFGYRPPGADQLGPRNTDIIDGFSNTIMFAEGPLANAAPWTKPEDLAFDKNDPLAAVDGFADGHMRIAFFDFTRATLAADISAASFSALVTRAGGETIDRSRVLPIGSDDSSEFKTPQQRALDMKEVVLAMHFYHDLSGRFPANRVGADGTPLLSWRVMLLPYLEQQNLFSQFRLNEPWDSPHNLSLLKFMPDVYRSIGEPRDSMTTRVMHFAGPNAPFPSATDASQLGPRWQDIHDGPSNTIAFIEAGAENAAPWTKPVDLPLSSTNPFSPLGDLGAEFLAAFFDGRVETLPTSLAPGQLAALITHQGGIPITPAPGIYVLETGGDTITNEFGVDVFHVVLTQAPGGDVVLELSTSDESVAVLGRSRLTFTSENWHVPQRVALRGVDNHIANDDQAIAVTISVVNGLSDSSYHDVSHAFTAIIRDDEPRPPALTADYTRDGVVDAADYTL